MWRMECCLCRLKQNVTYARAAAQQGPGIALGNLNAMFGVRRNVWNVTYARMDRELCQTICITESRKSLGQLKSNVIYVIFRTQTERDLYKTHCTTESRNRAGMWRMEGCLCRLRQNVTYASPIAQQNSLGTWLECDEWNVCVGSDRMWIMRLSFAQQTWPWDCLDLPQKVKGELGLSIIHDFTILSYSPISGGWANDKKNVQNLNMNIEKKFFIPPVFAPFGGILPILPIFGGYWPILPSIMGKKWGISHLCCLPESYIPHYRVVQFDHSYMGSGSFTCTSLKCLECQRTLESCLECQCVGMWVEWDEKQVWYVLRKW